MDHAAAWMPEPVVKFCQLTIDGVPRYLVIVSEWMCGATQAVRYGRTIYLSPAMWELLVWADDEEERWMVWDAIPKDGVAGGPGCRRVVAAWEEPGFGMPEIDGAEELESEQGCHAQS